MSYGTVSDETELLQGIDERISAIEIQLTDISEMLKAVVAFMIEAKELFDASPAVKFKRAISGRRPVN